MDGEYDYSVDASPKVQIKPQQPEETTQPTDTTEPSEPNAPNKPTTPQLPQTGQLQWPVGVLVTGGMILLLLGWYMRRSGKAEENEA